MTNIAAARAEMPAGTNKILDRRTVETDNSNLLKFLKGDIAVLDVGCGSGSITAGIANRLNGKGSVTGIDVSGHLIATAEEHYRDVQNLRFEVADINAFDEIGQFDLITSARVLQWLPNPADIVHKMKALLKPGGWISVLDYNHYKIEWLPQPPEAMKLFYDAFLQWRADVGFDNEMADNLKDTFAAAGLTNISVEDHCETTHRGDEDFKSRIGIWAEVAETRGHQLVNDGYITEAQRVAARDEYEAWIKDEAQMMKKYLLATDGQNC